MSYKEAPDQEEFYDLKTRKAIDIEEVERRVKRYYSVKTETKSVTIEMDYINKVVCLECINGKKYYARAKHINCSEGRLLLFSEAGRSPFGYIED